jgi:hypothetical protein
VFVGKNVGVGWWKLEVVSKSEIANINESTLFGPVLVFVRILVYRFVMPRFKSYCPDYSILFNSVLIRAANPSMVGSISRIAVCAGLSAGAKG